MIYIYQNKNNNVLTRFFDKRKKSDSYFLWKIKNSFSKEEFYFITEDISDMACSYNIFNITHSDNGSTIGGVDIPIDIKAGHNTYTVYETTEYSLDTSFIIKEIEKDIMFVELKRDVNTNNSNLENVYY